MMRPICAICGRRTTPFVFIGANPVGPTCARSMGLTKAKTSKNGRVKFADYKPRRDERPGATIDLFEGMKP